MSLDFLRETSEFRKLVGSIRNGQKSISLTGLIEPAKPYFLALLHLESQKNIVFIRPSSSPLSALEEQVRFFLSQFSSPSRVDSLPQLSENPFLEIPPSLESVSTRMQFFYGLLSRKPSLIVTNLLGLLKPFPGPQNLEKMFLSLEAGQPFERNRLLRLLAEYGYTAVDIINFRGEYAWRGGVVDVFSPWEAQPFRLEFSGDEIASLRGFDLSTQRSVRRIDRLIIPSLREFTGARDFREEWERLASKKALPSQFDDLTQRINLLRAREFFPSFVYQSGLQKNFFVPFTRYLSGYLLVLDDFEEVEKDWEETLKDLGEQHRDLVSQGKFVLAPSEIYLTGLWEMIRETGLRLAGINPGSESQTFRFPFQSIPRFKNNISFFLQYLKKAQEERDRNFIFISREGVRKKLASLLSQQGILAQESPSPFITSRDGAVTLILGNLRQGFGFPPEKIAFFSEEDLFTEERVLVSRTPHRPFISHFQDLKAGDYVIHTDCGIGIFRGLVRLQVEGMEKEFIEILYQDEDKLFVPVEDLGLVQKYAKLGTAAPALNKLGTPAWEKTKARTRKAIESIARELLELYARRKALKGFNFSAKGAWEEDFEKTFEYEETEDQLGAIRDIREDMESESPMDRLLCGDVGYGKTEVALRAAFKAMMDSKQVAVLCPTTVLASQHLKTFRRRLVLFPLRMEGLTRLQSRSEQKKILKDLKKGLVDAILGTHRLLSQDVEFKDLGLLVIDEEQRFGVQHKEKIKQMKASVDVLTMTATPIPRTLNLSLSGLRDISLIESPPKDRLAIHTVVTPFSAKLISNAIKMELARGGQVYFIHNRVEDSEEMAQKIREWVPQAKVVTVHGQMSSARLEKNMVDFIEQKYNVLVSTTIIENGIDIPLVNTLIVNRADRFGLAQLYQLRGRVGRSSRQAVAYFLVPPYTELTPLAKERLKALQEFSELGSGFRLAAKDLEIRGAGSFLGAKQHGYLEAVGFDYYLQLLESTVKELKGEKPEEFKSEVSLKVDIRVPEDYLPHLNLRLNIYKRVSSIESPEELKRIKDEIRDRYGLFPPQVENLFRYGLVKFLAQRLKIEALDRIAQRLIFKFSPATGADLKRLAEVIEQHQGSITPQGVMSLNFSSSGDSGILDETIGILKALSGM